MCEFKWQWFCTGGGANASMTPMLTFPAARAAHPLPTSGRSHADHSTHRCFSGRFHPSPTRGVLSWLHLPRRSFGSLGPTTGNPNSAPRRSCADSFTQCRFSRCHHPTIAHGVLPGVHLLQRTYGPTHGNASSASLPQPTNIATICSPSSTSRTSDRHACTTAPRAPPLCATAATRRIKPT